MKRRMAALVCVLMFVLSMTANAAEPRAKQVVPTLTFSGTTANCSVTIMELGKDINATMSLWCGNTLVDYWSGNAANMLTLGGSCPVVKGQTYTLKVSGTIGGVLFNGVPIIATC